MGQNIEKFFVKDLKISTILLFKIPATPWLDNSRAPKFCQLGLSYVYRIPFRRTVRNAYAFILNMVPYEMQPQIYVLCFF